MTGKDEPVSIAEVQKLSSNPFPGLRPFTFDESYLFFGHDNITDLIINKLFANKFVCLLGGAGVGKTSIINCGIKSVLLSNIAKPVNLPWLIFQTTPGMEPVRNLAKFIGSNQFENSPDPNKNIQEQICYSILKRGSLGLIELIDQFNFSENQNFLFIIDQFEDLFRLKYHISDIEFYDEALHYVSLFLEALKSNKYNIHVVISIRSDFTDDCVMFPNLADIINLSNVLIPKMNRYQVMETILNPLRVLDIDIDESLLVQILNDATTIDDMLPRIQHALHRTWNNWTLLNNPGKAISIKEYEVSGGIKSSVSNHANMIFDELNVTDQKTCEIIFKSLTERGSENKGLPRPCTIKELSSIAKVDIEDILRIIDLFRNQESGFIICSDQHLNQESIIGLSHVSLIRLWNRLKIWIEDEAISGQMYKQISESSAAYQLGKVGLLTPPDLQFAINWKEKQKPTLEWAKRYNPAFERTMVYLRTSLETYESLEALEHKKARQAIRKVRSVSFIFGSTTLIVLALTIYFISLNRNKDIKLQKEEIISKEALKQNSIALQEKHDAYEDKWKAELNANESDRKTKMILEEQKVLEVQINQAEDTARKAAKKTSETEIKLYQVSKQKDQSEQNALQAILQKKEADQEKEEAYKKRILSTSQSIAVKSFQMTGNKQLKSALALQAYYFNNHYGGAENHPDIYNALASSLEDQGQNPAINLKGHIGAVKSLCVSKSNILYSTGGDGNVFSWNLNDPNPVPHNVLKNIQGNLCLNINPDGRLLAVGSDIGIIKVIDLNNPGSKPIELKGHQGAVYSVVFSKDGQQLFSSGSDKKVLLWDISTNASSVIFNENTTVRSLCMSQDGKFLAGGAEDGRLLLWDIHSNQLIVLNSDDPVPVYSVAFNHTGILLASGDLKGSVKIWNPFTKKLVKAFKSHNARVVDIKFSPSTELMTSSSYDGSVYIFDTRYLNNPPVIIKEPSTWILSVAFSTDNKKIILATNKPDFIVCWPAQTKIMNDQLCKKVTRGLNSDEWNFYIGSDVKMEKACE
jgi:WD40 repeat protein